MSHLYVCHFSSGHIKVGRSIDPVARVARHADRVACVGIELVEYRTFECAGDVFMAEAALIERCDTECTRRLKSEWFEGLTFESACEWACGCAKTDFQAAHKDCATDVSWPQITITPERRRKLAADIGVHEQYLYQCLTARRDMNPAEARRAEVTTCGELTRKMLCQRTWRDIWPELAEPERVA